MASADDYAAWIVKNSGKKGTPEFDTVALAYQEAKAEESGGKSAPAVSGDDIPKMMPRQRATVMSAAPNSTADPRDIAGGLVRGAASIGATLTTMPGAGYFDRRSAKLSDVDSALSDLVGSNPNSAAYGLGKLGAEIAGTAGVGNAIAPMARVVGASPAMVNAIQSAGMRTGAAPVTAGARLADLATRSVGGGISGAGAAALVSPENVGMGAGIGAAAPPALKLAGAMGRAGAGAVKSATAGVRNSMMDPATRAADELLTALDLSPEQIPTLVSELRGAPVLVPGSRPTVAQALTSPQSAILDRVVSAGPGGEKLRQAVLDQAKARMDALAGVAPIAPNGAAQMRQDTGEAIGRFAQTARKSAKAETRAAYEAVPQDEAALYLPDLASVRDKYFGPGSFSGRGAVDSAANTADQIGRVGIAGEPAAPGLRSLSLSQAVRRAGGLSIAGSSGRRGELEALKGDLKNLVRTNGGDRLDQMAQRMHEAGYIADDGVDTLINALRDDSRGGGVFSFYDHPAPAEPIAATSAPQKVTLGQFDNLRRDIGAAQRAAARDPERAREAAALSQMKSALDDRINQVVRGDGAVDENLPIEWANQLDKARKLKAEEVARFGTGPQKSLFTVAADGSPVVQGGEIAAKFWGNRPGLADDVKAFRRLVADNPSMLGQFRSMITTEGAEKAAAGDVLGMKFVDWTRNTLPGLREAFNPIEVKALQNIAADVERAAAAAKRGAGVGSNTYQNAANALDVGLLGSPGVKAAIGRVPYARVPLEWAREGLASSATKAKAQRLADILANSDQAANALEALVGYRAAADAAGSGVVPGPTINALRALLANQGVRSLPYRAAPVAASQSGSR